LIMVSGLLIYAVFRKRDAAGTATPSSGHSKSPGNSPGRE
jgi:hypothetical protein